MLYVVSKGLSGCVWTVQILASVSYLWLVTTVAAGDGLNGWEVSLVSGGLALQMIGAVFSLRGIFLVWEEVAQPGEKFRALLIEQFRTTRKKLSGRLRVLLRRPVRGETHAVAAAAFASASAHASARISFGQLPAETDAAVAELTRRIDRIHDLLQDIQDDAGKEIRDRKESIERLQASIREEMDERGEEERRREVSSVRAEIGGFWFITIGFVTGGIGSVIGALT